MKTISGYVYEVDKGRNYCRFDYTDECGKRRTIRRRAENKTKAKELLDNLIHEYKERGEKALDGERMTFAQLADYYAKTYLIDPIYVDGRKVAGLRSAHDSQLRLAVLKAHFGKKKVKAITYSEIENFRTLRLKTPTKHGKQRTIATVNRELSILRRVFSVAVRNDWILRNPLVGKHSLICSADEKPRQRILTREEESRLLDVCAEPRSHLRPIIICALDLKSGHFLQSEK
jgi:hypothetical protein